MALNPTQKLVDEVLKQLVDVEKPTAGTSPIYSAVRPQMELVARIWMLLPGNGNPMAKSTPEEALSALTVSKVITCQDDIEAAVAKITQAFNAYFGAEIKSFVVSVGEETITETNPTKIFQTRRDEEVAEHNQNVENSNGMSKRLTAFSDKTKLTLVGAAPSQAKPVKAKGPNVFVKLFSDPVKPAKGTAAPAKFGWQTPPVFDPESDDAKLFDLLYPDAMKLEPDAFFMAAEASYGQDKAAIQALINRLYSQVNEQILLSQRILAVTEPEFKLYLGCMMAGLEFQSKCVDVGKFYGFTVGKAAAPAKKPIK